MRKKPSTFHNVSGQVSVMSKRYIVAFANESTELFYCYLVAFNRSTTINLLMLCLN